MSDSYRLEKITDEDFIDLTEATSRVMEFRSANRPPLGPVRDFKVERVGDTIAFTYLPQSVRVGVPFAELLDAFRLNTRDGLQRLERCFESLHDAVMEHLREKRTR